MDAGSSGIHKMDNQRGWGNEFQWKKNQMKGLYDPALEMIKVVF